MNVPDMQEGDQYLEQEPVRRKKKLPITIFVYDKKEELIREHKKDFRDKDHLRWLTHMMYWAFTNGYSVEIEP